MAENLPQKKQSTGKVISVVVNFEDKRFMVLVKEDDQIADLLNEAQNAFAKLTAVKAKFKAVKNSVNAVLPSWYPVAPLLKNEDEIFVFTDNPADVLNVNMINHGIKASPLNSMLDSGFITPVKNGASEIGEYLIPPLKLNGRGHDKNSATTKSGEMPNGGNNSQEDSSLVLSENISLKHSRHSSTSRQKKNINCEGRNSIASKSCKAMMALSDDHKSPEVGSSESVRYKSAKTYGRNKGKESVQFREKNKCHANGDSSSSQIMEVVEAGCLARKESRLHDVEAEPSELLPSREMRNSEPDAGLRKVISSGRDDDGKVHRGQTAVASLVKDEVSTCSEVDSTDKSEGGTENHEKTKHNNDSRSLKHRRISSGTITPSKEMKLTVPLVRLREDFSAEQGQKKIKKKRPEDGKKKTVIAETAGEAKRLDGEDTSESSSDEENLGKRDVEEKQSNHVVGKGHEAKQTDVMEAMSETAKKGKGDNAEGMKSSKNSSHASERNFLENQAKVLKTPKTKNSLTTTSHKSAEFAVSKKINRSDEVSVKERVKYNVDNGDGHINKNGGGYRRHERNKTEKLERKKQGESDSSSSDSETSLTSSDKDDEIDTNHEDPSLLSNKAKNASERARQKATKTHQVTAKMLPDDVSSKNDNKTSKEIHELSSQREKKSMEGKAPLAGTKDQKNSKSDFARKTLEKRDNSDGKETALPGGKTASACGKIQEAGNTKPDEDDSSSDSVSSWSSSEVSENVNTRENARKHAVEDVGASSVAKEKLQAEKKTSGKDVEYGDKNNGSVSSDNSANMKGKKKEASCESVTEQNKKKEVCSPAKNEGRSKKGHGVTRKEAVSPAKTEPATKKSAFKKRKKVSENSDDASRGSSSTAKRPLTQLPKKDQEIGDDKSGCENSDAVSGDKKQGKMSTSKKRNEKVSTEGKDLGSPENDVHPEEPVMSPWLPQTPQTSHSRLSAADISASKVTSWLLSNPVSGVETETECDGEETTSKSKKRSTNKVVKNVAGPEVADRATEDDFSGQTTETSVGERKKRKLDKINEETRKSTGKSKKKKKKEREDKNSKENIGTETNQKGQPEPQVFKSPAGETKPSKGKTAKLSLPKTSTGLSLLAEDESDCNSIIWKKKKKGPSSICHRAKTSAFRTPSFAVRRTTALKITKQPVKTFLSQSSRRKEMTETEDVLESGALNVDTFENDGSVTW